MNNTPYTLPAGLRLGPLSLTVADLSRSMGFYHDILGFEILDRGQISLSLGFPGGPVLLDLHENPAARPRPRHTGLYHFALLVPNRQELARALYRLIQVNYPLAGAADHLVSEALYLSDPDENGIEIYRDRPRQEWPFQNGELQMSNAPLDAQGLLEELQANPGSAEKLHPKTILGHLHLRVSSLPPAEDFYCNILGFELMQRFGRSAGFVSAGGYHHHLGFNTWESAGASPPPPDSTGLRHFTLLLPSEQDLQSLLDHLRASAIPLDATPQGYRLQDPSANTLYIRPTLDSE